MPELTADEVFNEDIKRAYLTALAAQRDSRGGPRVEIHVGSRVLEDLKAVAVHPARTWLPKNTLFGFPLVEEPERESSHISVHVVTTIA